MSLHTVVCVKVVPKAEEVKFNPETNTLDRGKAENILNPSDKCALEAALRLKAAHGGTVSVISMGPPFAKGHLELCLGMGADRAALASDRLFAGADTYPTARVLAAAVRKLGPWDIVLCGDESADSATGQVPQGIAEWLGIPQVTFVDEMRMEGGRLLARRALGSHVETVSAPRPCLASVVSGAAEPRFPDFRRIEAAAGTPIPVWSAADLGLREEEVGLKGSYTTVQGLVAGESTQRQRRFLEGDTQAKAREIARLILERLRR